MRNRTLTVLLMLIILGAAGCSGTSSTSGAAPRPALIGHIVYFNLESPDEADALIADCDALLATIPHVSSYACGMHLDIGRSTVRSDYDVAAYIGFESEADLRAYVDHPQHLELVNRWRSRISELRVYDMLDPTP